MEPMVGHRCTRQVHESLFTMSFPNDNLILVHYMLNAWWLHILYRLRHYVIRQGEISHILVIINNCRGDSCNGGEAHARSNKMHAQERKKE